MSFKPAEQGILTVDDLSGVGEARRVAARIAELTGLGETDRGKLAIIATEMATNLVRHARQGEMIIRRCNTTGKPESDGVELLSIDRGPGMSDVSKCLTDGYSTAGTAGTGFGAIRRLSSEFDVYSSQPSGTVVMSRVTGISRDVSGIGHAPNFQWGVICTPMAGETLCGDNWGVSEDGDAVRIVFADGLGHGPLAAAASGEALRIFEQEPMRQPGVMIDAAHSVLRSTRGAAMAVAHVSSTQMEVRYAGVGNISGTIIADGKSRGLFSHNGTVGLQVRKIQELNYPFPQGALLIMHSDGLQQRWNLSDFSGLILRHPAVIAAVLYRDFKRGHDDLTVMVLKQASST